MSIAQAASLARSAMIAAFRPDPPTTAPAVALAGVRYEDVPNLKAGSAARAIALGRALPAAARARPSPGCATALCSEGP